LQIKAAELPNVAASRLPERPANPTGEGIPIQIKNSFVRKIEGRQYEWEEFIDSRARA